MRRPASRRDLRVTRACAWHALWLVNRLPRDSSNRKLGRERFMLLKLLFRSNWIFSILHFSSMAEGGVLEPDLVADLLATPFSRRTFQEKLNIVANGRLAQSYQPWPSKKKHLCFTFSSPTTNDIPGWQHRRRAANCIAGNAFYLWLRSWCLDPRWIC